MGDLNLYFSIFICVIGVVLLILVGVLDYYQSSLGDGDKVKNERDFQNSIKGLISLGIILFVAGGSYLYTHYVAKCSCPSTQFDFKIYLVVLAVLGLIMLVLSYRLEYVVEKAGSGGEESADTARRTSISSSLSGTRYGIMTISTLLLLGSAGYLIKMIVDEKKAMKPSNTFEGPTTINVPPPLKS